MLNTMPQKAATYVHVKLYMAEVSAGNCAVVLANVYLNASLSAGQVFVGTAALICKKQFGYLTASSSPVDRCGHHTFENTQLTH